MKTEIKIKFCQNLSKFQDRIERLRRETRRVGGNSQPLRHIFSLKKVADVGASGADPVPQ